MVLYKNDVSVSYFYDPQFVLFRLFSFCCVLGAIIFPFYTLRNCNMLNTSIVDMQMLRAAISYHASKFLDFFDTVSRSKCKDMDSEQRRAIQIIVIYTTQ